MEAAADAEGCMMRQTSAGLPDSDNETDLVFR
jgi:hypothetical protein